MIVCDGDSLTAGGQAGAIPWPTNLATVLMPTSSATIKNYGVASQTLAIMAADAATQIDPFASARRSIVVCWGGTVSLSAADTAGDIEAAIQSYCAGRQAAGFAVVVGTLIARDDAGFTAGMETKRTDVNTWLRANYATFADAIADFAANAAFDARADASDTTYYNADKLHLNTTGYGLVAGMVKAAVDGIA